MADRAAAPPTRRCPSRARVAALGDCALGCGVLADPAELAGPLETILPVDIRDPRLPADARSDRRAPGAAGLAPGRIATSRSVFAHDAGGDAEGLRLWSALDRRRDRDRAGARPDRHGNAQRTGGGLRALPLSVSLCRRLRRAAQRGVCARHLGSTPGPVHLVGGVPGQPAHRIPFGMFYAGVRWGDARHWGRVAANAGIPVDRIPRRGAGRDRVVCGEPRRVRRARRDRTEIVISELNYDDHNGFRLVTVHLGYPAGPPRSSTFPTASAGAAGRRGPHGSS